MEVCVTGTDAHADAGQPLLTAAMIDTRRYPDNRILRFTLPGPPRIEWGTDLIIDQGSSVTGRFYACCANVCVVDYPATPELMATLRHGHTIEVQTVNLPGEPVAFTRPLAGFRNKLESSPTE